MKNKMNLKRKINYREREKILSKGKFHEKKMIYKNSPVDWTWLPKKRENIGVREDDLRNTTKRRLNMTSNKKRKQRESSLKRKMEEREFINRHTSY